jgi:hypothetical protein
MSDKLLFSPSNGLPPPLATRRRRRHHHALELTRVAQVRAEDAPHAARLQEWLHVQGLRLFTYEHSWYSSMLRQMYLYKQQQGDGCFALISSVARQGESDRLEDFFTFRKKTLETLQAEHNDKVSHSEKEFEACLRFTDTLEYLDTLALSRELTLARLLELFKDITHSKAFSTPSRVAWVSKCKAWVWEQPSWFDPSQHHSLAIWAAAALEKSLWAKYWEFTTEDPRKLGENMQFTIEPRPHETVASLEELVTFWEQLPQEKRALLIGDQAKLTEDFNNEAKKLAEMKAKSMFTFQGGNPQPYISSINPFICNYLTLFGMPLMNSKANMYRSKAQYYQSPQSLDTIFKYNSLSPLFFIEFLIYSPIDRSDTPLDYVNRKVLQAIREAFTNKMAEDLLMGEEKERVRKQNKKKRKKKKKQVLCSGTESSQNSEDERGIVIELLNSILNSVFEQAQDTDDSHYEEEREDENEEKQDNAVTPQTSGSSTNEMIDIKENEEDFKTIQCNRKKPRKQPQTQPVPKKTQGRNFKAAKSNKGTGQKFQPSQKRRKQNNPNLPSRKQQRQQPANNKPEVRHWERIQTQPMAVLPRDEDFPPMMAAAEKAPEVPTARLSGEIGKFVNEMLDHMASMEEPIVILMDKLTPIISQLFPRATLQLFGSQATGLAITSSDVDLAIINTQFIDRSQVVSAITSLGCVLQTQNWIKHCKCIATATVPIIKLSIEGEILGIDSEIRVDLTFENTEESFNSTHTGLASLYLTRDLLVLYPDMQYLAIVLKQLLATHNLNSAYHGKIYAGGLSSYSLVIWIAACFNSMAEPNREIGDLLLSFLKFYGKEFDPRTMGISILNGG